MTDDPRAVVRRLIDAGKRIPDDLRTAILGLRGGAVEPLVEILEDDDLALSSSPGDGWAPVHAAALLGELASPEAVEPMLRRLAATEWCDVVHDQLVQSIPSMGAVVIEPALRAHGASTDRAVRSSLAAVLAEVGTHDDRILEILIADLRDDPSRAGNLAAYGDARAIPHLSQALDLCELVETESPFANQTLVELRAAIEGLGGNLTPEQELKCRRGDEPAERFRTRLTRLLEARRHPVVAPVTLVTPVTPVTPVTRKARPGRNEPCWCGSTRKYKKCHLAVDEGTPPEMESSRDA